MLLPMMKVFGFVFDLFECSEEIELLQMFNCFKIDGFDSL
jgi:hypothetical protein